MTELDPLVSAATLRRRRLSTYVSRVGREQRSVCLQQPSVEEIRRPRGSLLFAKELHASKAIHLARPIPKNDQRASSPSFERDEARDRVRRNESTSASDSRDCSARRASASRELDSRMRTNPVITCCVTALLQSCQRKFLIRDQLAKIHSSRIRCGLARELSSAARSALSRVENIHGPIHLYIQDCSIVQDSITFKSAFDRSIDPPLPPILREFPRAFPKTLGHFFENALLLPFPRDANREGAGEGGNGGRACMLRDALGNALRSSNERSYSCGFEQTSREITHAGSGDAGRGGGEEGD